MDKLPTNLTITIDIPDLEMLEVLLAKQRELAVQQEYNAQQICRLMREINIKMTEATGGGQ